MPTRRQFRKPAKVTITVTKTGDFTYDPTLLRVGRRQRVKFVCPSGPHFEVMFKDQSPGDDLFLSESNRILTIRPDAPYGVYHYSAAVYNGNRVFIDSACGDIGVGR